jgi:general secretion pathway protein J
MSARSSRGFTLIEVMIAAGILAVMAAMTFGSFSQAWQQKEDFALADERYAQARGALDRITFELSHAFLSEHYDRKRFRERPTVFKGQDRGGRDELLFTSLAHERLESDAKESDQAVIRYWLERDPENPRYDSLWRRSNPLIDEDAERRGHKAVLCENVRGLDLEYWDAAKEEWVDEWDASRVERQGVLPERIKVTLTIVDDQAQEKKFSTQSRVMLQRSLDF